MAKNPMGKQTTIDKPYQVWENPAAGWKWLILKSYQADNNKPYARAFCAVISPYTFGDYEYGDVYWDEIFKMAVLTENNIEEGSA
mgnify:CR=1 FL=1